MSSHDFPVGSIVYFLHNKTERVLPAQVYEKIVRTSMEGTKATYIVKVRSKSKASGQGFTMIELDPEDVNVFQNSHEMRDFMVLRATEAVSSLVDQAVKSSSVFENVVSPATPDTALPPEDADDYESWHVPAADRPIKGPTTPKKEDYAEVDLGDGRKARLKMQG